MRRKIASSSSQGLVWRWLKAHRKLLDFRVVQEQAAHVSSNPPHKFWYGTKNRILIALTLTEACIQEIQLSKREIARRSNVSLPTVLNVLNDAYDLGFIDINNKLSKESLDLSFEKIIELNSSKEFKLLGEAIRTYHISQETPVDPFDE